MLNYLSYFNGIILFIFLEYPRPWDGWLQHFSVNKMIISLVTPNA